MNPPQQISRVTSYQSWAMLCREINSDAVKSRSFRENRYAFNHRLASRLVENLPERGLDQVIYAVHLTGDHPRPAYLGTSTGGHRRLCDLPVGESHHLSNTYPPETWERVQILHWRQVLDREGFDLRALEAQVAEHYPAKPGEALKLIGMGIEFMFQTETMPELNVRIKLGGGGFREVGLGRSGSRQALIAGRWMKPIFPLLLDYWMRLQAEAGAYSGPAMHTQTGSVVFPAFIFGEMVRES